MQQDSAVLMTLTRTFSGQIASDESHDAEIASFVSGYGYTEKEQAYIEIFEIIEVEINEFYFQSTEEPSNAKDFAYLRDGWYVDSGLYLKREVGILNLQPMKTE